MADDRQTFGRRLAGFMVLLAPILIVVAVLLLRGPSGTGTAPVDVSATGPRFDSIEDLVAASDVVVMATVVETSAGRIITDPTDLRSGIQTTIFTLEVAESMGLDTPATITVEYETALADGTPITVDGILPPTLGERGLYFLIGRRSAEFPHHTIINDQGRYPFDEDGSLLALNDDPVVTLITLGDWPI